MTLPLYHKTILEEQNNQTIHPSIIPHMLAVTFNMLTPEQAREIVDNNVDNVLGDFIREARQRGDLR